MEMSGLMTQKLDDLFVALTNNSPITTLQIQEAKTEYNKIRKMIIEIEKKEQSLDKEKCPHCKKEIPSLSQREAKLIGAQNEITRLRKELQLKISMCHDLEEQNQRFQERQESGQTNVTDQTERVGEMYSSLFTIEWLEAYEYMDNNLNQRDDKIIDVLQRILRATYEFCKDIADAQMANMEGEIYCPLSTWTEEKRLEFAATSQAKRSSSVSHLARQYRNLASSECVPTLQEAFINQILPEFFDVQFIGEPVVLAFTKKCIQCTWNMCIHTPRMFLLSKVNRRTNFDLKLFNFYTVTGDRYDFVVWPALLLGEDDRVVSKGVAQAIDNTRSHSTLKASLRSHRSPQQRDRASPTRSLVNPALHGTPWGSQFFSNRGTPSVDLPPTPNAPTILNPPKSTPIQSVKDNDDTKTMKPDNQSSKQKDVNKTKDKDKSIGGNNKVTPSVANVPKPTTESQFPGPHSRYSPPPDESVSLTSAWKGSRQKPRDKPTKIT